LWGGASDEVPRAPDFATALAGAWYSSNQVGAILYSQRAWNCHSSPRKIFRARSKSAGSAAWSGPVGRFTKNDKLAKQRAQSLAQRLSGQGIDPHRLVIGRIDSKFPNRTDEAELAQDRSVGFTLLAVDGREAIGSRTSPLPPRLSLDSALLSPGIFNSRLQ